MLTLSKSDAPCLPRSVFVITLNLTVSEGSQLCWWLSGMFWFDFPVHTDLGGLGVLPSLCSAISHCRLS